MPKEGLVFNKCMLFKYIAISYYVQKLLVLIKTRQENTIVIKDKLYILIKYNFEKAKSKLLKWAEIRILKILLKIYASGLIVILNFDYYYSIHYNVQFFEIFRHSMEDVSGIHALYINMLICSNILLTFFVFYFGNHSS